MNATVENLRRELGKKFPKARLSVVVPQAQEPEIRAFVPQTYPAGGISELVFPVAFSSAFAIAGLFDDAAAAVHFPDAALIDGADAFDPQSFSHPACSRLLWVRCFGATEMIRAAGILADGNLPLLLLDSTGLTAKDLRKIPSSAWWRLKQEVERTRIRMIVLSTAPLVPCAVLRLSADRMLSLKDFALPRREILAHFHFRTERRRHAN